MKDINTAKIPTPAIEDNGTVRLGAWTPPFPPVRAEPARVTDKGSVRLGAWTPPFPAPRAK